MRIKLVTLVAAIAIFLPQSGIARTTSRIRYEIVAGMSGYEVWHSAPRALAQRAGYFATYFEFTGEDAETSGAWKAQGVIGFGVGDLGETPLLIRIWSKGPLRYQLDTPKDAKGRTQRTRVEFIDTQCAIHKSRTCALVFSMDENERVYEGTKLIGRVRPPR